MSSYPIIDTAWNTSAQIQCLKTLGVQTVIRYYDNGNSSTHPQKRLELEEAQALSRAGLNIMVIFEASSNYASYFSHDRGYTDYQHAHDWAKDTIGQPLGSAIYFAVDYDASNNDLENNIIPYFKGIQQAHKDLSGGSKDYEIGVYGSGLVVNTLKNQGLCKCRWLSMSSGFRGTQNALNTGAYELHQIYPPARQCGLDLDFDAQNPEANDIGSFRLNDPT